METIASTVDSGLASLSLPGSFNDSDLKKSSSSKLFHAMKEWELSDSGFVDFQSWSVMDSRRLLQA